MKNIVLILGVVAFTFMSCGDTKKEETKQAVTPKEEVKKDSLYAAVTDEKVRLFTEKFI